MNFPAYVPPGSLGSPILKRRGERGPAVGLRRPLVFSVDRRKSKVWNYYTQLNETHVECNICKKQLSFHNSTTTMREHLVRKHSIRDGALPSHNTAAVSNPVVLHPPMTQSGFPSNRSNTCNTTANTGAFQPVMPLVVKEERQDADLNLSPESGEAKRARTTCVTTGAGGGLFSANPIPNQDLDPTTPLPVFPPDEINNLVNSGGSSNCSGVRVCSNKRAGVLTELILEMVSRDLQPLSVVEERGFRLLLSCLEPHYPVPSPSLLGSLLWHRYNHFKLLLQQHLQIGLAPRCLALCTERWRSIEGCGVGGGGRLYLTTSAHFVDKDWRLARCVLETRPMPEFKGETHERGCAQFGDTLKAVLSEFQLPESFVFCVVHDTLWGSEDRMDTSMGLEQEYQQDFAGPSQPLPQKLPKGWVALHCAGEALKLCVQEGLWVEPVRQALADARGIVLHFQHDVCAAAALNHKAEAANKAATSLVLDDPGRWATGIDMCESLLELKWVVSSVLEEQKAAPNLADHQWRLLQELVPVLRTVRIAASFLSEDINAPISALMPCLQGVSRLLGQRMAESSCPVARGVMERVRSGMEKRWRMGDEEALLESPTVLSSFLDPRFKELRFLSPHARNKLHDKVKELLSAQAYADDGEMDGERDRRGEGEDNKGRESETTVLGLDDSLSMAPLDSPELCGSAEEGDIIMLQQSGASVTMTPPAQVRKDGLDGGSPCKTTHDLKRAGNVRGLTSPLRGDLPVTSHMRMSPVPQSMYDILLGEDPTERMPEIHQQLENYIAEPLCKRSLSPLHWWRSKEHRFPAVARLARKYLAIPATAVPAERAFAPRESPAAQRRAMLGPKHLDHILFLHQNCDYIEQLKGGSMAHRESNHISSASGNQSRESLYQSLVSYESKVLVPDEEP